MSNNMSPYAFIGRVNKVCLFDFVQLEDDIGYITYIYYILICRLLTEQDQRHRL